MCFWSRALKSPPIIFPPTYISFLTGYRLVSVGPKSVRNTYANDDSRPQIWDGVRARLQRRLENTTLVVSTFDVLCILHQSGTLLMFKQCGLLLTAAAVFTTVATDSPNHFSLTYYEAG